MYYMLNVCIMYMYISSVTYYCMCAFELCNHHSIFVCMCNGWEESTFHEICVSLLALRLTLTLQCEPYIQYTCRHRNVCTLFVSHFVAISEMYSLRLTLHMPFNTFLHIIRMWRELLTSLTTIPHSQRHPAKLVQYSSRLPSLLY